MACVFNDVFAIWLPLRNPRSIIHDGKTTRCPVTGRKTGYEPKSDQDHITVYIGLVRNAILLHGHLYTTKHEELLAPSGLLPVAKRLSGKNGQLGRNPEIWKWSKQRAQEDSESYRKAKESDNWRRRGGEKKANQRNDFFSKSRLPKR